MTGGEKGSRSVGLGKLATGQMIAYRCHYEPTNLAAIRRMRSGAIGRPRLVVTDRRAVDPAAVVDLPAA